MSKTNYIEFKSLAQTTHSTQPTTSLLSLHEYIAHCLDVTQRETRSTLATPACPPSGLGSTHETVRAPKAA